MKKYKLEKVINVYSLEEMLQDPEKKKKLIEVNQPCEAEEQAIMDDTESDIMAEIEGYGFKGTKAQWDLSCCQGSGASFSFENVDIDSLIDKYPDRDLAANLDNAKCDGFEDTWLYLSEHGDLPTFRGNFNSLSNHYTHEKTVDVLVEHNEINEYDETALIVNDVIQTNDWDSHLEDIRKEVEKIYYDAAGILYKKLNAQWDWLHSEEAIIENLKGNGDLEFTSDGKCFRPDIYDYPDYTITEVEDTDDYVILDQDGKIWCSIEIPGNPAGGNFLDISDLPNMGKARARIMKRKEAEQIRQNLANNKIRSLETTELMLASEAFKEEKEK